MRSNHCVLIGYIQKDIYYANSVAGNWRLRATAYHYNRLAWLANDKGVEPDAVGRQLKALSSSLSYHYPCLARQQ